jgi:hypothetical protein
MQKPKKRRRLGGFILLLALLAAALLLYDGNTRIVTTEYEVYFNNLPAAQKQRAARVPETVVELIADSVADLSDEDDAVFMGELGNLILKKQPDFDCRNFGYKSLSALIKSLDRFDIDFRQTSDPNIKHPYVKDRQASAE